MLEIELLRGAAESLAQLPAVTIHSMDTEPVIDGRFIHGIAHGDVQGHPVLFVIECKGQGDPRTIQHALQQLQAYSATCEGVVAPLVAAPAISEASRELLRRHHVGYWDTGGSLYLELPWALYWIDRPVPQAAARILRNVYHGSAAQVLHAILLEPDHRWHINVLAERAQVSLSTAHHVCTFLEDQLWMRKDGKGPQATRTLLEPGALLDAWAGAHSLESYSPRRFHRWARSSVLQREAITPALDAAGIDYALTLNTGADLVAPYSTESEHLWALVPAVQANRLADVAQATNLRAVDEGENITFLLTRERSPLLFRREVAGSWVASDVQLYRDLWAWPRRGKEQAQHLRTQRLTY